jgi:hypothetical protein
MERGEPLARAKQSFVNAGYSPAEVAAAVQRLPATISPVSREVASPTPEAVPTPTQQEKALPTTSSPVPPTKKKSSKMLIILLSILGGVILIGAALMGIFYDQLFG